MIIHRHAAASESNPVATFNKVRLWPSGVPDDTETRYDVHYRIVGDVLKPVIGGKDPGCNPPHGGVSCTSGHPVSEAIEYDAQFPDGLARLQDLMALSTRNVERTHRLLAGRSYERWFCFKLSSNTLPPAYAYASDKVVGQDGHGSDVYHGVIYPNSDEVVCQPTQGALKPDDKGVVRGNARLLPPIPQQQWTLCCSVLAQLTQEQYALMVMQAGAEPPNPPPCFDPDLNRVLAVLNCYIEGGPAADEIEGEEDDDERVVDGEYRLQCLRVRRDIYEELQWTPSLELCQLNEYLPVDALCFICSVLHDNLYQDDPNRWRENRDVLEMYKSHLKSWTTAECGETTSGQGTSSTTVKHRALVCEPLGDKPVTDLPGIGKILGQRLEASGYGRAFSLVGQYLVFGKDERKFKHWLKKVCNANVKYQADCAKCVKEWTDTHL